MKVYSSVTDLIGNTPLMRLSQLEQQEDCRATVLAKLEYFNPAGSAKDRVAYTMIREAENDGRLCPGATVIEPTSGNTGVGLAAVAAARGYHVILTMPETMSVERQALLRAYGAEVVLTDGSRGMAGAIDKANELAAAIPGSYIPGQFDNPANPAAHYASTGPEIWRDTDGKVDIFVAGVGTGGTITGVARYLKEQNPAVQIIGVEPANSRVLAGGKPGAHGLQGIGANFVPAVLDMALLDEIVPITDDEAYTYGRALAHREGLLTGITAGAAVCAAFRVAKRPENAGKTVVALLPDTGERYLSTPLFRAENE